MELTINTGEVYAFLAGWVIGMMIASFVLWVLIPSMVRNAFRKAKLAQNNRRF